MSRWFVGSGGGSKGAPFHAGFLTARAEQGIEYAGAAGSSAGGLAAMSVSMHPTLKEAAEYMEKLALSVKTSDVHRGRFLGALAGLWNPSYRTAEPFIDYMKEVTKGKRPLKPLRLGITAITDAELPDTEKGAPGAASYFSVDETFVPLWRAGYATSAFPGVFEPLMVQGRWCLDGGVQVVTPLRDAIRAGATHLDVVIADTPWPSFRPTDPGGAGNTVSVLLRCLELAIHRLTWVDVDYTEVINDLVAVGHPKYEDKRTISMTVVHPTSALNEDSMEFRPEEAAEIFLRGYNQGLENGPAS